MDMKTIIASCDNLARLIGNKGYEGPTASIEIYSGGRMRIFVSGRIPADLAPRMDWSKRTNSELFHGDDFPDLLDRAREWINDLPIPKDTAKDKLRKDLADIIHRSTDLGLDLDFTQPLRDAMKKLSENVITHQPSAAE